MLSLLFLFVGGIRCKIPQIRTFVLGYLLLFAVTCLTSNGQLAAREHNLMLGLCFGMIAATYTYGRRQPRSPSSRAVNGASPANLASPTAPRAARPLVRRPARLAAGS
jgi:hypothetical protein